MKLKDIMPLADVQKSISQLKEVAASNSAEKNISNPKLRSNPQKILKIYNQVMLSGFERLKEEELELLQLIIFRIENDQKYIPSTTILDFAQFALQ